MTAKPRICFVGLKCYDLLTDAPTPRYIGGIENQLVLLGRGLAERAYAVSFVTFDHGQPDGVCHNDIRIYKAFRSKGGIPIVRFVHPRWTGLRAALARADADVYCQMGAGCETGQVALWCGQRQKRFVFATASDANCLPDLPSLKSRREKWLYRYGLSKAETVISQTRRQYDMLLNHYRRPSEILRAFTRCDSGHSVPGVSPDRRRVLWIGRICPEKRPHLLVDLSRDLPGCTVDVIGDANVDNQYVQDFRREAARCPSIVLHGKVSQERLDAMYSEAALLISTSEMEGFPVIFLEAWSRGIPVLSTFDPDGVIADHGLGWHESDMERFTITLRKVTDSPEERREASDAALSYYLAHHTVDAAVARFETICAGHSDSVCV